MLTGQVTLPNEAKVLASATSTHASAVVDGSVDISSAAGCRPKMSSPSTSSAAAKQVAVVKLLDNTHGMAAEDERVACERFEQLLQDSGQVDCPLLERLGYPVILVSTTPKQKCIPVVQLPPASSNPHNNRLATTAASRRRTGLAMGSVVGDVYALRKDGKDLTSDEWWELWDSLMDLMGEYGDGPETVTDELLDEYKMQLRERMQEKGLLKSRGTGSGYHCLECGEVETDDQKLLRCAQCKTARYCSKDCQKAHWKAGHRHSCKAPGEGSEASREGQLLQTAVLKPEQIIEHSAPVPSVPRNVPAGMAQLAQLMPRDDYAIFVYNKLAKKDRICLKCRTKYRLLANPPRDSQADREQRLSGICSYACFQQLSAGGPNSGSDWYGQSADQPDNVVYAFQ